jgi:hypothetical protein
MGKIHDAHDAKDQSESHADQGIERARHQAIDASLKKISQLIISVRSTSARG